MEEYIVTTLCRLILSLSAFAAIRMWKWKRMESVLAVRKLVGCSKLGARIQIILHSPGILAHMLFMATSIGLSLMLFIQRMEVQPSPVSPRNSPLYGIEWIQLSTYYVSAPLMLLVLAMASIGRFDLHRRLARVTLPLWVISTLSTVALEMFGSDNSSGDTDSDSDTGSIRVVWIVSLTLSTILVVHTFAVFAVLVVGYIRARSKGRVQPVVFRKAGAASLPTIVVVKERLLELNT
jgi:uncharacterized membrane protein YozB (DUF420 family)